MSWEAWPLLSTTSCLHACTSKIPQGVQTFHGVMAEAMHIVCSVDMALALVQAFQEEARVLVHVFHRLERVLAEPLTHPRNDGLVQEEVRQVCRLLCAVGTGKGTKAVADEGCVVSTINAWRLSRASQGPVTVESPGNACQARPTAQLVHHVETYRRILEPLHTLNAWRFSRASTGPCHGRISTPRLSGCATDDPVESTTRVVPGHRRASGHFIQRSGTVQTLAWRPKRCVC